MNAILRGAPLLACLLACEAAGDAAGDAVIAMRDGSPPAPSTEVAAAGVADCRLEGQPAALPAEVNETSGLARSRLDPDLFWTHNDAGGAPVLYAIDAGGALRGAVTIRGASQLDWEDIGAGRCESGDCLFVGDIGDNQGERESITIYRIPEPAATAERSEAAVALEARYPGGPRDAEALFVLPSGELFLVTKGERSAVEVYRFRAPQAPDAVGTLELVRELSPEPGRRADRVTGASASPDGRWVAIRTYSTLHLFPAGPLVSGSPVTADRVDLTPFGEAQGEAVVLADDGAVWLTSEAEGDGRPTWLRLRCALPRPR
ncbi:MAG TPA: hypothetical protein VFZ18_05300 [Longimicrobiaceae bacterium]